LEKTGKTSAVRLSFLGFFQGRWKKLSEITPDTGRVYDARPSFPDFPTIPVVN
jgi:hypothetical protein